MSNMLVIKVMIKIYKKAAFQFFSAKTTSNVKKMGLTFVKPEGGEYSFGEA